ncbi:UDP-N-acetylmuramoyl-L-alanine--D-glutamate ligase [Propionibacterium australiense]|uniref:UDP-N-acetylmuramoylalanine--D-glutamate ligase n=2 Tax=Propionibacterium australiense TaxID=119981 RepID=A0A8B3FNA2_9ACTN|nr:UDP-N-acetylmuramoyl-L-alanine--D-glutamate ligase [Propionibacterium australiense]
MKDWMPTADRTSPWGQARVVVAGLGASGYAAADALLELGAAVTVLDDGESSSLHEHGRILQTLGAEVRLGPGSSAQLPEDADLVVTSPSWRPDWPLLAQAAAAGLPIWGEPELAWRLVPADRQIAWLGVTGTNGKTTTTQMLDAMLRAAGLRSAAVGNIGRPIIEAINDPVGYEVFAVELSSFQLHWSPSPALHSAAVLNLHADHLEWYDYAGDTAAAMAAYGADKARIFHQVHHSCVYNIAEPATRQMVADADVVEGARAIGFTLGIPSVAQLGVVDDQIVDRAFIPQRQTSALPLAALSDVEPYAPHNVENALAAAALARSFGVPAGAVAQGLRDVRLGGHHIETVAEAGGVRWVDDSKATNPHAANSSMRAFERIVWIAGGQAKGTSFDDLITTHRERLCGAILLGVDRRLVAEALAEHAPQVPVVVLDGDDTALMSEAVRRAAALAEPGDTVLLAPGCASRDMWAGYAQRGDDFAAAVRAVTGQGS